MKTEAKLLLAEYLHMLCIA